MSSIIDFDRPVIAVYFLYFDFRQIVKLIFTPLQLSFATKGIYDFVKDFIILP